MTPCTTLTSHIFRNALEDDSAMGGTMSALGVAFAERAMTVFVRICPQAAEASPEALETACAAMRSRSREALDRALRETQAAPWLAQACFADAVLDTALAGREALAQAVAASRGQACHAGGSAKRGPWPCPRE